MKTLCQAAGASVMDSVPASSSGPTRTLDHHDQFLILIPEEIDDDIFTDQLLPTLVQRGVLPAQSQFQTNHHQESDANNDSRTSLPVVYYSWLVKSITADMVAPVSPFRLGSLLCPTGS
jgi:hypothetical protein